MYNAYKIGEKSLVLVTFALMINVLRIGFRFIVVMHFELGISPYQLFTNPQKLIYEIFKLSKDIMYRGDVACSNPSITIPIFKLSGVLQWVSFYAISFIF